MGVVTVSASFGAGGAEIAPAVADRLGLTFHDRVIPAQVAGRLGVPVAEAEANDETITRGLWRLVRSLGTMPDPVGGVLPTSTLPDERAYRGQTERVLGEIAAGPGGVVLGRAAAMVLRDRPDVLHVRLGGPAERRRGARPARPARRPARAAGRAGGAAAGRRRRALGPPRGRGAGRPGRRRPRPGGLRAALLPVRPGRRPALPPGGRQHRPPARHRGGAGGHRGPGPRHRPLTTQKTPEAIGLRGLRDVLERPARQGEGWLRQPRTTLPARMQEVQALMRARVPAPTTAFTAWMFGFQRRGVRGCEWDTDMPKPGPLPHTSHTAATVDHSQRIGPAEVRSRCRRTPEGQGPATHTLETTVTGHRSSCQTTPAVAAPGCAPNRSRRPAQVACRAC